VNPDWVIYQVFSAEVGDAVGIADDVGGTWQIVQGPGTSGLGCDGAIPPSVLSDFGLPAPGGSC
jgi:hypothetical protein